MRKIIYLTLMMIIGMSSVSFGKEYVCHPDRQIIEGEEDKGDEKPAEDGGDDAPEDNEKESK